MIWRIIGGVVEVLNDEERKYTMDYERQQMRECNGKSMANVHVHVYSTLTDIADEHQHVLLGVSGPADIVGRSHVHPIGIRTSFMEGHWHWVDIMTDSLVPMTDGTHSHYFAGRTTMEDGHCHNFSDVTNISPDMFVKEEEKKKIALSEKVCKYKYKRPEDEEYN